MNKVYLETVTILWKENKPNELKKNLEQGLIRVLL